MNATTKPSASQLAHLAAAASGELFVNGRLGDQFARPVWIGGRVNRHVVERLLTGGLIEPVALPGCSAQFRYDPTPAGALALTGSDEGNE